jgi:hypothetical protein
MLCRISGLLEAVVWCGVVWFGVEWCGAVQYGGGTVGGSAVMVQRSSAVKSETEAETEKGEY